MRNEGLPKAVQNTIEKMLEGTDLKARYLEGSLSPHNYIFMVAESKLSKTEIQIRYITDTRISIELLKPHRAPWEGPYKILHEYNFAIQTPKIIKITLDMIVTPNGIKSFSVAPNVSDLIKNNLTEINKVPKSDLRIFEKIINNIIKAQSINNTPIEHLTRLKMFHSDLQVIMTHETLKPSISIDDMLETINTVKDILINAKELSNEDLVKMSIVFKDTIAHIEEIKGEIK